MSLYAPTATERQWKAHRATLARRARLNGVAPSAPLMAEKPAPVLAEPIKRAPIAQLSGSATDPRFVFSSLITGRSNTMAVAAARRVVDDKDSDTVMFNPLFIHGGVGLGKTHIAQATVSSIRERGQRASLYLTAEDCSRLIVEALKCGNLQAFIEPMSSAHILVFDDLHNMQSKTVQREFSAVLNALIDSGTQVVVTADCPPIDLQNFDERLRSRLASGLVVEIGRFSEEMRLQFLRLRLREMSAAVTSFDIPDDALAYLSQVITSSPRALDGVLKRLLAQWCLTKTAITRESAERDSKDLVRPAEPKRILIEDIQRAVCRHYNISLADLISARRTLNVVIPRQVAAYLCKQLTLRSLPEIGRRFGGRDHTTILSSVRKIERLIVQRADIAETVAILTRRLSEAQSQ